MTEPIDEIHAISMDSIMRIRRHVRELRREVATWEPKPCPNDWNAPPKTQVMIRKPTPIPDSVPGEVLYADELLRSRQWFR